jgi:4-hydroxy-tetrahydrodipicolinate synthase
MYKGCFTAIVTPFLNNKIDTASLFAQACFLKENGVNGIVCCGTTGEGPVLTSEEYSAVTIAVRSAVGLDYPVITGAGSNNTVRAVELSKIVAQAGADAVLSVTPFYNKPSQSGLIAHFTMIADKSPVPVILYNVPGRTGVDMSYETVKNIV